MKKLVSLLMALALVFALIPAREAEAASYSFSLSGSSTFYAGQTISFSVRLKPSSGGCSGFQGKVTYSTSLFELDGVSNGSISGWSISSAKSTGTVTFTGYDTTGSSAVTSATKVLTVKLKVKSVSVGTTGEVAVSATGSGAGSGDSISCKVVSPPSNDCNLKSLTVNAGTLEPEFSTNTLEYTLKVPFDVSSLNVTAKARDNGARVAVTGDDDLVITAPNIVNVTVTAANGDKKVYTITVLRERDPNAPPSTDNSLLSLSVDNGVLSPAFSPDWLEYAVYLPYEISTATVSAEVSDFWASLDIGNVAELAVGANVINVTVTSEAGEARVYTVNIHRGYRMGDETASDVSLSSLAIAGAELSPAFSPEVTTYTAEFETAQDAFDVTAVSTYGYPVSVLGDTSLVENNESIIVVAVAAPDGTIGVYLIRAHVKRADSNAALSSLTTSAGTLTPEFDPDVFLYTLSTEEADVLLTGIAQSEDAVVACNTSEESYIGVSVTAADGSMRVYTVVLEGPAAERGFFENIFANLDAPFAIAAAVILIVLGMLLGMLIFRLVLGPTRRKKKSRHRPDPVTE